MGQFSEFPFARTPRESAVVLAEKAKQEIDRAVGLANLSALRMTLAGALERAADAENAENAVESGEINQAIGAALGIDTMLQEAAALHAAALALHRKGGRP